MQENNNSLKQLTIASIATSIVALSILYHPLPVHAADDFSLGVFPPIFEIDATPPTLVIQDLTLQNFTESETTLQIQIKPFKPDSRSNGRISFDTDRFGGPDSLIRQKISVLDQDRPVSSITLGPLETKQLHLSLDIKNGDPAGDYYFSIIFLSNVDQPNKPGGSTVPGGVASNVLLSVGPKGPTKASIKLFTSPTLLTHGPVPFTLLVKNNSNHFIEPKGSIVIENMFGQKVGKTDILSQAILANSDRYLIDTKQTNLASQQDILSKVYPKSKDFSFQDTIPVVVWNEQFLLGLYTAKLRLALSENGPYISQQAHFLAIPIPFMLGIISSLIIVIGIYLRVRKKRKSRI